MNTLKKLFFCFFVTIFLVCVQEASFAAEVQLSEYALLFGDLTGNNQDAVDIRKLKGRLVEEEMVPQKAFQMVRHTEYIKPQSAWKYLFDTMKNTYQINLALCRAAEQLIFTSDFSFSSNKNNLQKLANFCATFTYCCQNNIIQNNNDPFIIAIRNNTCNYPIIPKREPELAYVSTLVDRLQNKINETPDKNTKNILSLLQYFTLELFNVIEGGGSFWDHFLANRDLSDISAIVSFLEQYGLCADLENRIGALNRLPNVLKKFYKPTNDIEQSITTKGWHALPYSTRFFRFYLDFDNKFRQFYEQHIGEQELPAQKTETMIIREQLDWKRQEAAEKKRAQRILYLKLVGISSLLAAIVGGGALWWYKFRKK